MKATADEKAKRKAKRFAKRREALLKAMRQDVAKMREIVRKQTPTT